MFLRLMTIGLIWVLGVIAVQHHVDLQISDNVNPVGTQYNYYRMSGMCPNQPILNLNGFTKLNATPTGLTYSDTLVSGGLSYCYVATAVYMAEESQPGPPAGVTVSPFQPLLGANPF